MMFETGTVNKARSELENVSPRLERRKKFSEIVVSVNCEQGSLNAMRLERGKCELSCSKGDSRSKRVYAFVLFASQGTREH